MKKDDFHDIYASASRSTYSKNEEQRTISIYNNM